MYSIGIDIGGTTIKAGIVDKDGNIIAKHAVPTPLNDNDAFLQAMLEATEEATKKSGINKNEIESIGIGSPGIVERSTGVLVNAHNVGFENLPARDFLQKNFVSVPVEVENDANNAALGEFYMADNATNFVFITLGTGVGGGVVIDGKLLIGSNGAAGELGHVVAHANGRECSCGRRGCWETYASVTGLIRTTEEHRDEIKGIAPEDRISGRTVFDLARKGDKDAERVRDMWIKEVAIGIADYVNIFQPDEIVIGGAISKEGDTLVKPIRKIVEKETFWAEGLKRPFIRTSKIGGDAGIIGAAFLYKNRH